MPFLAVFSLAVLLLVGALCFAVLRVRGRRLAAAPSILAVAEAVAELDRDPDPRRGAQRLVQRLARYADAVVLELTTGPASGFAVAAHRDASRSAALARDFEGVRTRRLLPETARTRALGTDELPPGLSSVSTDSYGTLAPVTTGHASLGGLLFLGRRPAITDDVATEIARLIAQALENARLRRDALAAENAKSDFLAVMSHELKTPLNIVLGYADLLAIGVPDPLPDGALQHLERMRSSARDLLARINEILAYARMDDDPAVPVIARVDLAAVCRDSAAAFAGHARARHLELEVLAPEATTVYTDRERVAQILFALLANAVRFTHEGRISVELKRSPGGANIAVRDTGAGIGPEHIEHIFDPFWQVNRSATRTTGGLGLGLSMARKLAQSIGATLSASAEVGRGSTFTLFLPEQYVQMDSAGDVRQ